MVAYEWENKVVVNTNIRDLNQYIEHVVKPTNRTNRANQECLELVFYFIWFRYVLVISIVNIMIRYKLILIY